MTPSLPASYWIRTYDAKNARLDVAAGLSLAAFAIPESIAYASFAEVPPVSGLYCYLVAGVAYALFGTSRQLAVGPTSSLAVVVTASLAAMHKMHAARIGIGTVRRALAKSTSAKLGSEGLSPGLE